MSSTSRSIVACLAVAAFVALPVGAQQQAGTSGARIELTTSSDKAKAEYALIYPNANNLRGPRARQHALNALAADPTFGLARVHAARLNADLTAEQRAAEIGRAMADMAGATAAEVMLALYYREGAAGRTQSAQSVLRALADMVPGDPDVHAIQLQVRRTGAPAAEALWLDREFIARFPDYAAAYNTHAYTLYTNGEKPAALAAAGNYMRLAPDQPNSHDTYADLLLLEGRYDEAIAHSNVAIKLDSSWVQGYSKIGAILMRNGVGGEAREWFKRAQAAALTPAARMDAHNWIATTYVVARDGKNALRELDAVRAEAEEWKLPAATRALTHLRLALIEAHLGSKQNVAAHIGHASAINGTPLVHHQFATYAWAGAGDAAQARAAADTYAGMANAAPNTARLLSAVAAVTARDFSKAESELAQITVANALANELRAEIMKEQGKKAEAAAAKADILGRPVKSDAAATVDVNKVVARLRAAKL